MGLLSAIGKSVARYTNEKHTDHRYKNAKIVAYSNVGKIMKKANKKGIYVDCSKLYQSELRKENRRIYTTYKRRDNFINDL